MSIDCSFTHCASETDTKIWRYKLFYIGLKSLCCDVLSQKEKVIHVKDPEHAYDFRIKEAKYKVCVEIENVYISVLSIPF